MLCCLFFGWLVFYFGWVGKSSQLTLSYPSLYKAAEHVSCLRASHNSKFTRYFFLMALITSDFWVFLYYLARGVYVFFWCKFTWNCGASSPANVARHLLSVLAPVLSLNLHSPCPNCSSRKQSSCNPASCLEPLSIMYFL